MLVLLGPHGVHHCISKKVQVCVRVCSPYNDREFQSPIRYITWLRVRVNSRRRVALYGGF